MPTGAALGSSRPNYMLCQRSHRDFRRAADQGPSHSGRPAAFSAFA